MAGITPQTPVISPVTGLYTKAFLATITCANTGVIIKYTTDGSIPNYESTTYTTPILVTGAIVIKAIAYGSGTSSGVATATYTMATSYVIVSEGTYGYVDGTPEEDVTNITDGDLTVYNDALMTSETDIDLTEATTTSFRYRLLADTWEEQDDGMSDDVQLAAMYKAITKMAHLAGGTPEIAALAAEKFKELDHLIRIEHNTTKHLHGSFKQVSF